MKWILMAILLTMAGCAAPNTVMVNPLNEQITSCASYGWGWGGAPMALIGHHNCVEAMESAGWMTVDDYKKMKGIK